MNPEPNYSVEAEQLDQLVRTLSLIDNVKEVKSVAILDFYQFY